MPKGPTGPASQVETRLSAYPAAQKFTPQSLKLTPYNFSVMKTLLLFLLFTPAVAQTPDPHSIPSIDGGLGSCAADFTITDNAGKPIYAATIKVHIAYGFGSVRKLDLQVGTNVDGKARFTGLPSRVKRGLYFEASEGDRSAEAFDDPEKTCQAQFTLPLQKTPQ